MLSIVHSCALKGIDAVDIAVEVNSGERGDLKFVIVGLPDMAIKESYDRIFSALPNSGYNFQARGRRSTLPRPMVAMLDIGIE
jgi:magnesium chelatase family protein